MTLDACRARWRDAPPLNDDDLRKLACEHPVQREATTICRLVAEILRLRDALHHAEDRSSRLLRWYNLRTTDDADDECPRSTGRRR